MALEDELETPPSAGGRKSLLVGGLLLLVGGGAAYGLRHHTHVTAQREAVQNAANALSALQRCLIGEPLQPNESVTWRAHRIEVNREPVPPGAPESTLNARWPYRCAVHATTLRDSLGALDNASANQRRLGTIAERVRTNLTHGETETSLGRTPPTALDELWAAGPAAQLPTAVAIPVAAPPPAANLLTRADIRPLFTNPPGVPLTIASSDRAPGSALRVALAQRSLFGCQFIASADAAAHFTTVRCPSLGIDPPGPEIDVSLFDADDAYEPFPPVRIGAGRTAKITGLAPGAALSRPFAYRGGVTRDGTITIIDGGGLEVAEAADSGRWHITRGRGANPAFRGPLTLPPSSSRPDFVGDRVLWLASSEPGHGPARVGLFSRPLLDGGAPLGPVSDVGDVPEDSRIAARCRTLSGAAVVIAAPSELLMSYALGPRWGAFGRSEGRTRGISLTCGTIDATATWLETRASVVHQMKCDGTRCAETEQRVPSLGAVFTRAGENLQIAEFSGKVIVVWSPAEGGLRMRMAPLAELDGARDVVLYDDHQHRGGWVTTPTLFVRRNVAVVMFVDSESETDGQRPMAIRIDPSGAFRAITAE